MGFNYYEANVNCPFFQRSNDKSITCEGVKANTINQVVFRSEQGDFLRKEKQQYMNQYCCNNYKECLVYQMLNKKYE